MTGPDSPSSPSEKQSFEEFRGWLRGFLENREVLQEEEVKRIQEELEKVDPSC